MTTSSQAVSSPVYRIEGPQTIADVERELREIEILKPLHTLLPVRPAKWWFGGEAALAQLLITWGKQHANATLVTHIAKDEDPAGQLGRLVKRPFGLVAAWMAHDVTDLARSTALKVLTSRVSEPEIDLMWFGRRRQQDSRQPSLWAEDEADEAEVASVGDRVFLASIDHHPRWRVPHFYFPTGEVRHRDDFVALADTVANKATSGRGGSPITANVRGPIGAIVHELFKNTHEWARTDETGVPLLRSVRGLLAQGHSWAEREAMEAAVGSPPLAAYMSHAGISTAEGRRRFLELSVFDSGPGLARRWLSSRGGREAETVHTSPQEEYAACIECFKRWNSSARADHKGLGLHEVLQTLSRLGAFFRVRTGRLSLYRDFVAQPYRGSASGEDCSLSDWTSRSDSHGWFAPVEGVLYTMLIPTRGASA